MVGVIVSGGIASGKSTVTGIMLEGGAAVVHADEIGHFVLRPEGEAFSAVAEQWPQVVDNDRIDRGRLAEIVFADPAELARLEAITHPAIGRKIREITRLVHTALFVVEIPVMARFLGDEWVRVAVVADSDTRRARLLARGMDSHDIEGRMAAQPTDAAWRDEADHVITNDGSMAELRSAVTELLVTLRTAPGSDLAE